MTRIERGGRFRTLLAVSCAGAVILSISGCLPGGSKAARLQRADTFFKAGELEKAEIEYLNVLKADPRNQAATARLGIIFQMQGKWPRAILFLQRAKAADTNNADLRRALALTYLSIHERAKARDEAEFVLQKAPADQDAIFVLVDAARNAAELAAVRQRLQLMSASVGANAAVHVGLGELALKLGDLKSADSEIKKAVETEPSSPSARAALANLFFAQTNRSGAEELLQAAAESAPPRSFVKLKWPDHLKESGRIDESRLFLEKVVKQAPGYIPPLVRLGQIALEQRRFDDANTVVDRLLAVEPLGFEGRMLSGKLKLAQGQGTNAVEEFERLAGAYPRVPAAFYQLAVAQLVSGLPAKSVSSLNQAVALDPNYVEAVLMLAELNLRRGEPGLAIASLGGLLARRPNLAQPYYVLADAYRIKGSADQAVPQYRRIEQLSPMDPRAPFMLGLTFLQLGKTNDARQSFERVLRIAPDYLGAVTQLAELDLDSGQSQVGLDRLRNYIATHTNDAGAYSVLAQIHLARREEAQAEEALRKTIELTPNFARGYVGLAKLMAATGRQQQAVEKLEALLARNPKDIGALMMLGTLHERLGNSSKARNSYDQLLEVNPRFVPALNNAAHLYSQRLGEVKKGLELARRARELSPYDPYAADTLGWILYQAGEFANALTLLQESAQKLPGEGEVLFHLGMVHYMLGNEILARSLLERALESKNKDFDGKAEAQAGLATLNLDPSKADKVAATLLEKRLEKRPEDPVALARMVAILVREGEADRAIRVCERALKANANSVPATMQLARLYVGHKRNPERALEYAKAARSLASEDADVAYAMGKIAFQSREFSWAYGAMLDAVRTRADQPEVLFATAMAAYGVGRVSEAESLARRALQQGGLLVQSNEARRLLTMTALWREPAKVGPASVQIGEELRADPDFVPTLMVVGLAHELAKNPGEARKAYERALSIFPTFTPAMKEVAKLLVATDGDQQRAYELAGKAREAFPDDPEVARTFGIAAFRRGEFVVATRALKEASRQRPTDPIVFFYLGMSHSRLKQAVEGRLALGRALELEPNASFVAEARKAIADLN